jgi:hypothetical protein
VVVTLSAVFHSTLATYQHSSSCSDPPSSSNLRRSNVYTSLHRHSLFTPSLLIPALHPAVLHPSLRRSSLPPARRSSPRRAAAHPTVRAQFPPIFSWSSYPTVAFSISCFSATFPLPTCVPTMASLSEAETEVFNQYPIGTALDHFLNEFDPGIKLSSLSDLEAVLRSDQGQFARIHSWIRLTES